MGGTLRPEHWLYTIPLRLRSLFRHAKVEKELDDELRFHLERNIELNVARGLAPEEARYAALRAMGGIEKAKEESRDSRRTRLLEDCLQDLRYGWRTLSRAPAFASVAILTLALGIGANTAVFTVVNGVLLRPMPFPEPERLFLLSYLPAQSPFAGAPSLADRHYLQFRDADKLFSSLCSFTQRNVTLTGVGDPVTLRGAAVTSGFFAVLKVHPARGRGFAADEDQPGRERVVVLGDALWRSRFGADPRILGEPIRLDGVEFTVVGVMPAGFAFPYNAELWTPFVVHLDPHNSMLNPVLGRLKPGATPAQALAELETLSAHFWQPPGTTRGDDRARILPLKELLVADARRSILIFAGAVAFVLLIACTNVANLFLARAAGREGEMAVREALGASRGRLIRQALTESTLISLAGGVVGILLASWVVPAITALAPAGSLPRMEMIRVDGWVLGFTFVVSVLTGIFFGLFPALRTARLEPGAVLANSGRSVTSRREALRGALVISEVALSLVLLSGASLMLKSFLRLRAVKPGFEPANVLALTVDLPQAVYRTSEQMQSFHADVVARLSRLPGVQAAGAVNWRPLGGLLVVGDFVLEGGSRFPPGYLVDKLVVSPGYFQALGIRLVRGREFTDRDNASAPRVVMISESVALSLWPGEDPLGKRISMEDHPKPTDWLTIVGVVNDVKQQGLARGLEGATYQPYQQVYNSFFLNHMTFFLRTTGNPAPLVPAVRSVLRQVDKDQPAQALAPFADLIAGTTAEPRFQTRLLGAFAVLALVLAAVGLYGVLAYNVAQRTREFGIRMALGAQTGDIQGLVIRRTLALVGAGIVLGVAGALFATRVLQRFLFEVTPQDPAIFVLVVVALTLAGLAAGWIPARRATRVDPMTALRYE
jgi:predicted permease